MANSSEVLVIGAGPAGIASAIAARLKGLDVSVADFRRPPIEKACGEGLLPEGVAALRRLGIQITPQVAQPFHGLHFRDNFTSVAALFPGGQAFGVRRTALHNLLLARARDLGVRFQWGSRLTRLSANSAELNGETVLFRWLVGADGFNSLVRKLAGLNSFQLYKSARIGFRRHFSLAPWSELVEVYWGDGFQIFVTPTACDEVCLSLFSSDSRLRLAEAVTLFPDLVRRLRCVSPSDAELGSITSLRNSRRAARGRIALVGDASCTVDGIAGQGLTLAFQQAISLGDALAAGDLSSYAAAHHHITENARRMTGLLLLMSRSPWIRRKIFRLFSSKPDVFARVISLHSAPPSPHSIGVREVFHLTLEMLGA